LNSQLCLAFSLPLWKLLIALRNSAKFDTGDVQSAAAAPRGGSYKYFVRGKNSKAGADDFRVEVQRKKKLKPYDQFLKRFQYGNALDAALAVCSPCSALIPVGFFARMLVIARPPSPANCPPKLFGYCSLTEHLNNALTDEEGANHRRGD
jgi:hypothetical protein